MPANAGYQKHFSVKPEYSVSLGTSVILEGEGITVLSESVCRKKREWTEKALVD